MRIALPTSLQGLVPWATRFSQRYEQDYTDLTLDRAVRAITISQTLSKSDSFILADATGGAITVTLPSPIGLKGRVLTVKRMNAGANAVSVASASNIDGAASKSLASQFSTLAVVSDDATWNVV